MPRPRAEIGVDALRGLCSAKGVVPRYVDADGDERFLQKPDLTRILADLEKKGAADLRFQGVGKCPSDLVHFFWSDPEPASWCGPTRLPVGNALGLFSACRLGYRCILWTYNAAIEGLPKPETTHPSAVISLRDAAELWPAEASRHHLVSRLWRIQHVADYVRVVACCKYTSSQAPLSIRMGRCTPSSLPSAPASASASASAFDDVGAEIDVMGGSWLADLDNIWLNPRRYLPSLSGDLFATMPAALAPWFGLDGRKFLVDWIRFPGTQCFFSTPCYFAHNSPVLLAVRAKIESHWLFPCTRYNWIMRIVKNAVRGLGRHLDFVPEEEFNPVGAAIQRSGALFKARSPLKSKFQEIAATSTCFCQYWSSTKGNNY